MYLLGCYGVTEREREGEKEKEREREKKAFGSYGCKKYGSKVIRFKMESVVVVNVVAVPVGVNSVVAELGVFRKKCAQNPGEEILCVTRFDEIAILTNFQAPNFEVL